VLVARRHNDEIRHGGQGSGRAGFVFSLMEVQDRGGRVGIEALSLSFFNGFLTHLARLLGNMLITILFAAIYRCYQEAIRGHSRAIPRDGGAP
jgi:hypothetical protein